METVTVTRVKSEDVLCDMCGQDCNAGFGGYDVHEVDVRIKTGKSYPESGSGEEYEADICVDCMTEKVIPALKSLGCKAEWKDWDW